MAAANVAANRPNAADLLRLAQDMRPSQPELPFLKPLASSGLGQNINTVI